MADEFTETVSARIMGEAMLAFITARLYEDEDAAQAVVGHVWYGPDDDRFTHYKDAAHIARHDPARVLREIEGKRLILARYEDTLARQEDDDYPAGIAQEQAREYEDFVLPGLAAAWSDHPGYRQEWAPTPATISP